MSVEGNVLSGMGEYDVREGIVLAANALGIDPIDLATVISYETSGTFDPDIGGPTTQYGRHRGFIQFGEPQAEQFGVDWNDPVRSQLGPSGAIVRYLRNAGVRPGMGLMDIYSAVNAGSVGRYNASDSNNGGAPGSVRDKVFNQMSGHRQKAESLLSGMVDPIATGSVASDPIVAREQAIWEEQWRNAPVIHSQTFKEGEESMPRQQQDNFRQVPNRVLDEILGKDTMSRDVSNPKARKVQKKTIIKEGRKGGGYNNPRGGDFTSRDVYEQLEAPVGGLPEETGRSVADRIFANGLPSRENRGGYDKNDPQLARNIQKDAVTQMGGSFTKGGLYEAANMLGIEEDFADADVQNYASLAPQQKQKAWSRYLDGDMSFADAIAKSRTAAPTASVEEGGKPAAGKGRVLSRPKPKKKAEDDDEE